MSAWMMDLIMSRCSWEGVSLRNIGGILSLYVSLGAGSSCSSSPSLSDSAVKLLRRSIGAGEDGVGGLEVRLGKEKSA